MTDRTRLVTIVAIKLAILCPMHACLGQDQDLVVRVASVPEKEALARQRVTFTIDVLARDLWANLPGQLRIDVAGAIVVAPPNASVRLTEQIDGGTFIGQRYEFWIFPQRAGDLEIPSLALDVELKPLGFGKESQFKSARTDAIAVRVRYPEGAGSVADLICTQKFSASQQFQPSDGSWQVGDGITRTVTRVVEGTPAMALAPISPDQVTGIRIYPKQPDVEDKFDRGSLTGTRTDRFTYVFEQPGTFQLPEIKLSWWDLNQREMKTEMLDGLKVEVQQAETTTAGPQAAQPQSERHPFALLALVIVTLAILVLVYEKRLKGRWQQWRREIQASEPAVFRDFVSTARSGDPEKTLRALIHWWDIADTVSPAPRLDLFLATYGSAKTAEHLGQLQAAVDAGERSWQGKGFVQGIKESRNVWLKACQDRSAVIESDLPPLNPMSGFARKDAC